MRSSHLDILESLNVLAANLRLNSNLKKKTKNIYLCYGPDLLLHTTNFNSDILIVAVCFGVEILLE